MYQLIKEKIRSSLENWGIFSFSKLIYFVAAFVVVDGVLFYLPYFDVFRSGYEARVWVLCALALLIYKIPVSFVIVTMYIFLVLNIVRDSTGLLIYSGLIYVLLRYLFKGKVWLKRN